MLRGPALLLAARRRQIDFPALDIILWLFKAMNNPPSPGIVINQWDFSSSDEKTSLLA